VKEIRKSDKLESVCYDIRGPVMEEATRMEEEGCQLIKLNIGNMAPFGFNAPEEILQDMIMNLSNAQGYVQSQGVFSARKAVMQETQRLGIEGVGIEDIYIGNGVSELIQMSMQALLNSGDEILIPAPDYPLWTASATLAGAKVRHYLCDEESDWIPDMKDMESKISDRTRGIVIINPNNPTGSVYPLEILEQITELARKYDLVLFADEIYEKIVYEDARAIPLASLSRDLLVVTFNGLSKAYRSCGFRAGWMFLSGDKRHARGYIEGLKILSNMRLCSNVPSQYGIQTALGGYQSINDLTQQGGRLISQRDYFWNRINSISGLSCKKPRGALYLFPKIDKEKFGIHNDMQFILDMLKETHILAVQGTGFNWPDPDHMRLVFLPTQDTLEKAADRMERFLENYRQN